MRPTEEHPVLLVVANWRERAFILAELEERGHDVRAIPGIIPAIGFLIRRPHVQPDLVILDTSDDPDVNEQTLRDLLDLTGDCPWLVLASATRAFAGRPLLSNERVTLLTRPVRVEDVVTTAENILHAKE